MVLNWAISYVFSGLLFGTVISSSLLFEVRFVPSGKTKLRGSEQFGEVNASWKVFGLWNFAESDKRRSWLTLMTFFN